MTLGEDYKELREKLKYKIPERRKCNKIAVFLTV